MKKILLSLILALPQIVSSQKDITSTGETFWTLPTLLTALIISLVVIYLKQFKKKEKVMIEKTKKEFEEWKKIKVD